MQIQIIPDKFSVCQVEDYSVLNLESPYFFIGQTPEEKSLVCPTDAVPKNVLKQADHWRAFKIQGVLDFSLIGILAKISGLLAENNLGLFTISTYNTDYILTQEKDYQNALDLLQAAGYELNETARNEW